MTHFILLATSNVLSSGLVFLNFTSLILNVGILTFVLACGYEDHVKVCEVHFLGAEALYLMKFYSYVLCLFLTVQ